MKIKYWLMIVFLIVMLLPVITLYFLYVSLASYDEKQDIIEYMAVSNRFSEIENIVKDVDYYKVQTREQYHAIDHFASDSVKITLYRPDGMVLYSSMEEPSSLRFYPSHTGNLYKGLNEIQKNYRTYSLKKPVFQNGTIIGLFEITIGREEWVKGVNDRTNILAFSMIVFFILLYTVVVFLLHHKLNKPLTYLQAQMTAFANGQEVKRKRNIANDEIGELFSYFHRMKKQIEETQQELIKQQKEKEFIVAALSHDLKTPLTVIQAYTEALRNEVQLTNEERLEYRSIVFDKLDYMKQMLDDLAIYTALQSTQEKMELVEVEGQEFFDMLLSGYEEPCVKKDIALHIQQDVRSHYDVNVKQMMRIIDNLMSNGIRHTKSGQSMWLAAISKEFPLPNWIYAPFLNELERWRKDGTVILIQNQGEAIPNDKQSQVFQPFKQVEGARGLGGSSGLGLSIAKMLIEKHQGKIQLWSKEGYGTLVACWIKER